MPSSDDDDVFENMPPVVRTAASDRMIARMKRTLADPVAMAKIEEADAATTAAAEAELLAAKDNDLTCIKCRTDPTVVSPNKQKSLYTRVQLDRHSESNYHSRREQLRRAFIIDVGRDGRCKCPCCCLGEQGEEMYLQEAFLAHMESDHKDVMDFKAVCVALCRSGMALDLICKVLPDFARETRSRVEAARVLRRGT